MMAAMSDLPLHNVCLALGANIGDRLGTLRRARAALAPYVNVTATSPIYETAPAYATDQPAFLNAALRGETALDPLKLLFTVKELERELGRMPTFRYGPRAIDIDILFYDDLEMHTSELTIPHPLLCERVFVLKPLADVAPDWIHPAAKVSVKTLLDLLPDQQGAWPYNASL